MQKPYSTGLLVALFGRLWTTFGFVLDDLGNSDSNSFVAEEFYESLTPLERPYKSRVLAHYPEDVVWNSFDDKAVRMVSILGAVEKQRLISSCLLLLSTSTLSPLICSSQLCMPGGLSFRTEKKIAGPKYHTFIVTREDGSRCYGYVLTIFEEVEDNNICSAIRTLQVIQFGIFSADSKGS